MMKPEADDLLPQELLEELSRLGKDIYESSLKARVETESPDQYIAIHVDSGDYAVAKSTRALRQRHSADGRIYLHKIGEEPEYSLLARLR